MKKDFKTLLKAKKTLINVKLIEISKGARLTLKISRYSNNPILPYIREGQTD
jgi:hypothetical protein